MIRIVNTAELNWKENKECSNQACRVGINVKRNLQIVIDENNKPYCYVCASKMETDEATKKKIEYKLNPHANDKEYTGLVKSIEKGFKNTQLKIQQDVEKPKEPKQENPNAAFMQSGPPKPPRVNGPEVSQVMVNSPFQDQRPVRRYRQQIQ